MAFGRAARAALALVVASAASSGAAQAVARPVAIYPLARGDGALGDDAQALLETALQRATNRTEDVVMSEPAVVRPACGAVQSASVECLAKLAGHGLLVRAKLHKSERSAAMALEAVDGASGRVIGPVTVSIDLYIQNAEPLTRALLILFEDVRGAARRQAGAMPRPAVLPPPLTPVAPPKAEPPKPPPPKPELHAAAAPAKAPAAEAVVSTASATPRRSWARAYAPWVAGAGVALLAGAAVVSIKNQDLSNELERKYQDGTLGPEDAASYRKVDQYNRLTVILAASGGALTLTSAVMFTAAPTQGGASVALAGRF